jgi:integrase/recombinase XerD
MKPPELGPWLQRFFREHLITHRNVSCATLAAYRDTFRLLFQYLKKTHPGRSFTLPL